MGDACEMLIAAELTLAGIPASKAPDLWPDYDIFAQPFEGAPLKISVKSRTLGKAHYVAFDPDRCDWLAVVLLETAARGKECRHIYLIPSNIALEESHELKKPKRKSARCRLTISRVRKILAKYKDNFVLDPNPSPEAPGN